MSQHAPDAIVVGAGLAGLTAALRLAEAGASVRLVSKGSGGLQLSQGTIDVLGYSPAKVDAPLQAIDALNAGHPYTTIGADAVRSSLVWLLDKLPELLAGDPERNVTLPTAVGALRPTCLAQPSMLAAANAGSVAVVGVRQLKDFHPELIAGNLHRQGVRATPSWISLEARPGETDPSATTYARALDDPAFARRFARQISSAAGDGDVVLLPAVLGLAPQTWLTIAGIIGRPIAEVPLPPPSIPGLRLYRALLARAKAAGVRHIEGSRIVGFQADDAKVSTLRLAAAGGPRELRASTVVFAPGGFESGGLSVDSYGHISEPVFGLPLTAEDATTLVGETFWGEHALFRVGVRADVELRPVNPDGTPVHPNLRVAGGLLAGAERWRDKSGDGIALASGWRAAESIIKDWS